MRRDSIAKWSAFDSCGSTYWRKDSSEAIDSFILYSETERPGELLPADTHRIIACRYHFAARLATNKRTLEVGSGPGVGMGLLSRYARSLIGVELSDENIQVARCHFGDSQRIVRADAHKLPFADASFDLVVALAMVYYLNIDRFLAEVKRILEPGGCLFFCMSNKDVPGFVAAPHTTRYYSVPELSAKLDEHDMTGEFLGVFPVTGSVLRRQLRAVVKNTAKAVVSSVPGGRGLWQRMRTSTLGPHFELPNELEEDPNGMSEAAAIPVDGVDRTHRVFYIIAWT